MGKKLLVALVGAIAWYQAAAGYFVVTTGFTVGIKIALLYSLPLTIIGIITVLMIYQKDLE